VADIFISYTSADREWAHWIAKELELLDHIVHVHDWEVKGGDDIYAWMETHLDAADHVLCVVSDDYMKAPFSTLERHAALWQAADKRPGFVLLVVVKTCKLPVISDHIRRCELFNLPNEAARLRFRDFVTVPARRDVVRFPGRVVAVSNIPIRVPTHFVGRDDAFTAIDRALTRYEGRVAITALHGMRGVGKTTLAAAYADRHLNNYRAIWWIRAETEIALRADLVALGIRLAWVDANDKEDSALSFVMERLRHEGDGVLLIYDNAIDPRLIEPYLPRSGAARVLVTSNAHAWRGLAEPVEIRLWPKTIGADYLVARTGRDAERQTAETLSEALGGLPLAHEQAAAYCERLDVSLNEYAKRFTAAPARLLDDMRHAPTAYHDGLTVAKTFALAIAEAAKLHPAAEPLIVQASVLASEPIPLFLFANARGELDEPLKSALIGDGLDEILATLRDFALIDRETIPYHRDGSIKTDAMRLHRLVREVAATRCDAARQDKVRRSALAAVAGVYPRDGNTNPASWPCCAALTAHLLAVCDATFACGEAGAEHAELLTRAGTYFHGRAAYASARPLLDRALTIREKVLGPTDPDTAHSLNDLAVLLQQQGDLAGARPLYERALDIREKILGPEHPDTAESLNNLAWLLQVQCDFTKARSLFERALAITEKAFGPVHPNTAQSLNNLGSLLQNQGDLESARPLFENALAITEKALGDKHASTVASLNNLALLLQAVGDVAGARPLFERALSVAESSLGDEHPSTATTLNNFALLLKEGGDADRARELYERALAIDEKVLGPEHPNTATDLANLGILLEEQGDLTRARLLHERALGIREIVLGSAHPDTAQSLDNLAMLLQDQGNLAEARPLFERALEIREKMLGSDHPDTATSANNLASLLHDEGDFDRARPLYERAAAAREKVEGPEHSLTATALNNLARLLQDQGDLSAARPLFERALEIGIKALGPDHHDTNLLRCNLARSLIAAGSLEQGLAFGQTALAAFGAADECNHPSAASLALVMAQALNTLGRNEEAEALRDRYGLNRNNHSHSDEATVSNSG
jgi:tetratricopeptide (TPR) repeat protein